MRIYLLRHAQTEANRNHIIQGQGDSPLTPEGLQNTYRTALCLQTKNIDMIFSSPLGRTAQTSHIIADTIGIHRKEIVFLEGLKEIDLKPWAQEKISLLDSSDAVSSYKTFKDFPLLFRPDCGENFTDVQRRVQESFHQIVNRCLMDANIVVVSHSVTIRAFLLSIDGYDFDRIWDYEIHPLSVTEILYQNSKFNICKSGSFGGNDEEIPG